MPDSQRHAAVHVALGPRSYDIALAPGSLDRTAAFLASCRGSTAGGTALVVTDSNLSATHGTTATDSLKRAGWKCRLHTIPAGESSKCQSVVAGMYDALVDMQAERRTVVVAVGGGVVGDAAGFAAATYNRGLPFLQVPTSLLAMVDSSVGGKVGINHPQGKNLIGAFHQPIGVLIDLDTLATLPDRDYRGGLAEVVKYGMILDADFFCMLEQQIGAIERRDIEVLTTVVARSCRLKAGVVEQDEQERTGLRAVLNYGHTFAHAYEAIAGYGQLSHGEAVGIGMIAASRLAERVGLIDAEVTRRQVELLSALQLPTQLPAALNLPISELLARMRLDKKNAGGRLRFILPTRLGEVKLFDDVPEKDVVAVLESQPE